MTLSIKRIVAVAGVVGTLGTAAAVLGAAAPTVRGVLESGPLPVAARAEVDTKVAQLAFQMQAIQKENARHDAEDAKRDAELNLIRQQQLEGMLSAARNDYAKAPTPSGRAYMCDLISQVDAVRILNGFPVLPPC